MSPRAAVGVLAGLLFAVGLFLGGAQHATPSGMECGSAFTPIDVTVAVGPIAEQECASALFAPRIAASTLAGIGVLGGLYLGLTGMQTRSVKGRVQS